MIKSPVEAMNVISCFITNLYAAGVVFDDELKEVEEAETFLNKYIRDKEVK